MYLDHVKCWDKIPLLPNKPVLRTKFMFRKKQGVDKNVARYNARLAVCEYEEDEYQEDTYSPVADFIAVKRLMYISTQEQLERHLDFDNAFSHGLLQQEVYAKLPSCLYLQLK